MNRNQNRTTRPPNHHYESYLDVMRSNNILLNRIMDHIQVSERTLRSELEHNRTIDQQFFNILNTPRNRPANTFTRRNTPTQTFNWDNLSLSPVRIMPSQAQIRRATTNTIFREIQHPNNLLCPITQQPFESNDEVTIIDQCNHIFSRTELAEWFGSSVRCPVCRFDIREHSMAERPTAERSMTEPPRTNPVTETNASNDLSTRTERHILNSLAESINTEIDRLSGNEQPDEDDNISDREFLMDPSGNLTYRFTLRSRTDDNLGDD